MKLSIVIVNYNVKHFLEQCLHSVVKATKNIDTEVFVVDNNSVDGSIGMLIHKFPQVKLIANKRNMGFSTANNQAIRQSTGQYVLLLNPDTVVEEDSFEKIIDFMDSHPEAGALGVKMIDGCGKFLPESKRGLPTPWVAFYKMFGLSTLFKKSRKFGKYHLSYLSNDEIHEVDVLAGAFMFIRRKAIDISGLLDEDFFMYGEDIDLSYRITQSGYKNYYFPETTIIHYKGESTKKGSLNYVRMFYNAMIIFARKHFSKQYAGLFSLFIHLAIYFRALIAAAHRLFKKLWLPALDFLTIWLGFLVLLPYWENFRYEPGYYPDSLIRYIVPAYILSWLTSLYYSGGYERPVSLLKILRGLAYGTIFILVVYSLLPNSLRFSRAIILMGAIMASFILLSERIVLHFAGGKKFRLGSRKPKRVAIIGLKQESKRVRDMLRKTGIQTNMVGYISPKRKPRSERYLGSIYQVREIIRINHIEELIFCANDISSQLVIQTMMLLTDFNIEYKIAPPASVSIIGSNSIETAGDLYVVNVNAITREKNRRNKRLFDVVFAFGLLIFNFIAVWFVTNKSGFFRNIFRVLSRQYSWVGYHPVNTELYLGLPIIQKGILTCTETLDIDKPETDVIERLNVLYARDYKVIKDIEIVFKSFTKLGR
ncbi:MAG: glycosyltransferase [Prolixibacteraceae bacterium]|nr:glycosyltransferase [Prolixibacteraceae bacterium]MBN2648762.1 glycosyltransferase [Prolixibacteraceae bacterium]